MNHYLVVYPLLLYFLITTPDETVPGESMDGNLQAAGGWDILLLHLTYLLEKKVKKVSSHKTLGGGDQALVVKEMFLNLLRMNQGMDNLSTLF